MAALLTIITHLHPSTALADLVKDIKLASGEYIKSQKLFSEFNRWQYGYTAFTYSIDAKDNLINYIKNQEEQQKKVNFIDEYKSLLAEHKIELMKSICCNYIQPQSGCVVALSDLAFHARLFMFNSFGNFIVASSAAKERCVEHLRLS